MGQTDSCQRGGGRRDRVKGGEGSARMQNSQTQTAAWRGPEGRRAKGWKIKTPVTVSTIGVKLKYNIKTIIAKQ